MLDIDSVLNNNWFWTLWGTLGAYGMLTLKSKKLPIPVFSDIATLYFGITSFLIGFMVQFSFLNQFINAVGNGHIGISILYNILLALMFISMVKALFKTKWLKPFGFIIMMFTAGVMARSLMGVVFNV